MNDFQINQFVDYRGFNILMLASEAGHIDAVKNLISRGEEVNFEVDGETAASLAFSGGHYQIVLELLKANSKLPHNYQHEIVSDELKTFVNLGNEMHLRTWNARKDEEEELKSYLRENIEVNPCLRYFFDDENSSLLRRSVLAKKFSVYEFLLSLNIFLAPHESMDELTWYLTSEERSELSEINLKASPNLMTEPMMILMRNCKLGPDSLKERQADFMHFIR